MDLSIGQTILQLRKKCKITQEQLAKNIGVTAQAVSKWETDVSYPDIGLLPIMAEFFGVSVDYILGYNIQEKNMDINEYLIEIEQLNFSRNYNKALQLIEEIQTFPINYNIEYQRAKAKQGLAQTQNYDKDLYTYQAISIFEMIIQNCTESKIVDQSKLSLAGIFNDIGEYDKAINILKSIESHIDITGVISRSHILKGDYKSAIKILQERLLNSIDGIFKACFVLCSVHNKLTEYEKAIKYIELSNNFLNIANKNGKTNIWNYAINTNFFYKVFSLINANNMDDAIGILNQQVDFVIHHDNSDHDELNFTWYLQELDANKFKSNKIECKILLDSLKKDAIYSKMRTLPNFNDLINKLEIALIELNEVFE